MTTFARETIRRALEEDIGVGDITSEAFIPDGHRSNAQIIAKEDLILAGTEAAVEVFRLVDPSITVALHKSDGAQLAPGDVVLSAGGPTRTLLAAERTALNFLQQLSGIATLTRDFVDVVMGTNAVILDTRKTTPGLREFERAAVVAGGGVNHRFGLFDQILAKDNHLAVTGDAEGLQAAIARAKVKKPDVAVEIEADTLDQVRMLCTLRGVNIILLDNMTLEQMREAVGIRGQKTILLEASGGVNLKTVRAIAETGVDCISVGALTHSARAVDFSMEIK
ncbi:MAG: carboxylating nicotinate-nucleotide diphosphorylase [Chthoniobacterales bacterium]|jgi:nicotinate-nucleotide pyrophosphorylase (carboxylating)|nr:carboxylating nicotinate-nucleotide diphosphorylase [Chthoniobacterales bacterium]